MAGEDAPGLEVKRGNATHDQRAPLPILARRSITPPAPPLLRRAGIVPPTRRCQGISAEYGRIVFEAMADDRHLNPLGGVHGGFAATVLDSVTGCAVHTVLEPGVGYGTVDLNIKMLKAVPKNMPLTAEGKVIHISKSLGVAEGTLKDKAGVLYAHATATCLIFR